MIRTIGAFLWRDLHIEMSYNLSFLLQILGIFPSVLMFYFLSGLFGNTFLNPLKAYGGSYFPFVLIGVAVQNYFTSALSSFAGGMREAQLSGTLEAVLSTPVSLPTFLFGSALYAFVLNSIKIGIYLTAGCLIAGIAFDMGNILEVLLVIALSIAAFSSMGVFSASFIILFKKGDPLNWAFSVISWLLGGVFYPVSVLPDWLQTVSLFIPITHSLEVLRVLLLGHGTLASVTSHILVLCVWAAVGLPVSYFCFAYALKQARNKGDLGHY
jgi:ABC-2 type transport system permease protein